MSAGLALITGASAGIGLEIARQLAGCGYDIVGVGASGRIHRLAEQLPGIEVHPISVDLASQDGVTRLWEQIEDLGRPLDIAVLNAGVSLGGSFLDAPVDAERTMIALNITSQIELAKNVVPAMAAQRVLLSPPTTWSLSAKRASTPSRTSSCRTCEGPPLRSG